MAKKFDQAHKLKICKRVVENKEPVAAVAREVGICSFYMDDSGRQIKNVRIIPDVPEESKKLRIVAYCGSVHPDRNNCAALRFLDLLLRSLRNLTKTIRIANCIE